MSQQFQPRTDDESTIDLGVMKSIFIIKIDVVYDFLLCNFLV